MTLHHKNYIGYCVSKCLKIGGGGGGGGEERNYDFVKIWHQLNVFNLKKCLNISSFRIYVSVGLIYVPSKYYK